MQKTPAMHVNVSQSLAICDAWYRNGESISLVNYSVNIIIHGGFTAHIEHMLSPLSPALSLSHPLSLSFLSSLSFPPSPSTETVSFGSQSIMLVISIKACGI